ncbi:hypothetical protein ACIPR7_18135 [Pectobacterium parvum]|uniref:Uncharacterized protein n=1 Tax=Pectobacterium odoriferum TaxID=78398 RepID=A0ABR4VK32_9GAMM|nr:MULTISPECIES: hypothetical protein [Pectobacterium]AZK61361.1 hypothetical protein EIP93_03065 [Pectobacterium versatile]KGA39683.1 hypothetical protein KU75_21120 [Pectobacterium odoriferum]MCU1793483.1 hypothetical protein [Pectobacterium polaris]QQG29337.1 hypothetical protein JFY74_04530 [Pectobacterium carotovorum]
MGSEDVIDALIADGHQTVTLYTGWLATDDDRPVRQFFLLDERGDVVAKKLCMPGCYRWSLVLWPPATSHLTAFHEVWALDLLARDKAKTQLFLFS